MTLATTHMAALCLGIFSLICLGSWANSFKLAGRWRFELFYFDFSIGVVLAAVILAATAGSLGFDSFTFMDDVVRAGKRNMAYAFGAGAIFNLGNMLLVAALSLVGMSISFPLAIGLAITVGTVVRFMVASDGNPVLLFTGAAVVALATAAAVFAYRFLSLHREVEKMKAGAHRTLRPTVEWKGVFLSLAAGVVLGTISPLVDMAREGETGVGPYVLGFMFCAGILMSTFIYNLYFMNLPVRGEPVEILAYFHGERRQHIYGVLGGIVWALGAISALVLASSPQEAQPGPVLSYALAQGSFLIAALWGLLAWKEVRRADVKLVALFGLMFFLFLAGLTMLAIAPLYPR